jgi:hypothetical protein
MMMSDIKRVLRGVSLVALALGTPTSRSASYGDAVLIERFRTEAPVAWQKLADGLRVGFESPSELNYGSPGSASDAVVAEGSTRETRLHRVKGGHELVETRYEKGDRAGTRRVEAINSAYAFELAMRPPSNRWALESLERKAIDHDDREHSHVGSPAFSGVKIEGNWLTDLVDSKGFHIESAEVDPDDVDIVCVRFKSAYAVDKTNTILGGKLCFDSKRFWTLTSYNVAEQSASKGTIEESIAYQDLDGFPFPRTMVVTYSFPPHDFTRYVYRFGPPSRNVDEDDFRLSAYGLPEPGEPPGLARGRLWAVLIVLGVICLIVAVILRQRSPQ